MGKPDQGAAAAAGARRATGDAAGNGRGGRFSARRKRETVLRLLRGEDLESVSRELGVTAARASQWRDQFLAAGQASLKSRAPDARDEANRRLQAKIGELLMENELLYAKVDQLEAADPAARRHRHRRQPRGPQGRRHPAGPPGRRGHTLVLATLQPGPQSHRALLREAQGPRSHRSLSQHRDALAVPRYLSRALQP